MKQRLRLGMVGGGKKGYIGSVHQIAARFDDEFELVAGALSSDPLCAAESAKAIGIAAERTYTDFSQMADRESKHEEGIDAVTIVTPNHLHAPVARAFLQAGIHIICDKPLALTLQEGLELQQLANRSGKLFAVTYTYSGYPMVRHAKELVAAGELGEIRYIQVEYLQDWLATPIEQSGDAKAAWRTDPHKAGVAGCLSDIGTHAYHLASFISGLSPAGIAAHLSRIVPGRRVDDHAQVVMDYENGAKGTLIASQIATGEGNALRIRIYGTRASIRWEQEDPDYLWLTSLHGHSIRLTKGRADGAAARHATRFPAGHPQGFFEAFAQLYRDAALQIQAINHHKPLPKESALLTTVADGVEGMRFVEAALRSASEQGKRIQL